MKSQFPEVPEDMTDQDIKLRIFELKLNIDILPPKPIFDYDAQEADHELKKLYRRETYAWKKLHDPLFYELLSLEGTLRRHEEVAQYKILKAHCIDPEIQAMADLLHDNNCEWDHNEHCDYHYGNWTNEPRMSMFEWYKKAEALNDRGFDLNHYEEALKVVNDTTKMLTGEK